MAKESMKAREVKRAKTVAKYAEKRKALKEAGDYEALQKLPKNASPIRKHNRSWCKKGKLVTLRKRFSFCTIINITIV